ncbi:Flp pilus assembly protein CpaB [Alsobacter soli]|uniref:Flp pilus assembly protein CpaB n=1 Tax=Alsobacter soli TaxID=2109933 RepID=A0A2T1HX28_9HYPH|nr:Flp pilus assembly protein CpaB [Alsobacter soli]PSC06246.1 Flp pilus assembly protein CpaB [Alsobacter soli]
MTPARLGILGVALTAGAIAAYLASGSQDPAPAPAPVAAAPAMKTVDVLVTANEVPLGGTVTQKDVKWQTWPADAAGPGMITKQSSPGGVEEINGAIARSSMLAGEPVRREKVVKAENAGVLSALLPAGSRALAITIDNRGANTAGGFVLPNDRVDVIRTFRDEAASKVQGGDVVISETLLRNIRVLAIGQNIQEHNGEKVVVGETATLELDPRQVETVTLAQRTGQLSLALRSLQDVSKTDDQIVKSEDASLTVVRYGTASQR